MSSESEARVEAILSEIRKSKEGYIDSDDFRGTVNIIRRLNTESAHFIWELLQNTEDAEAEKISFTLEKKQLIVQHTGGNVFSPDDVKSICRIGVSSKAHNANKIGKFGVGFKSVFNYTDSPLIYSKDFRFRIENYVYPTSLPKPRGKDYGDSTVFILPFKNTKKLKDKAYSDIKEKLLTLSTSSLIFLRNIEEITVNLEDEVFTIKRTVHRKVDISPNISVEEIELKDRTQTKRYLRFTLDGITLEDEGDDGKPEIIENQSVMLAYRLDENGIIKRASALSDVRYFFVSFPTKIETHLEYLVHAPFSTSSSRETIESDSPANEVLYDCIADLVAESFLYLVQEKMVTTAFYDEVLLDTESSVLHKRIRDRLSKIVAEQNKVLPTTSGEYASLDELLLFSESNISTDELASIKTLFSAAEIAQNINSNSSKKFWDDKYVKTKIPSFLRASPTYKKKKDEVDFSQLVKSLSAEYLEGKTVETINLLYNYLYRYWDGVARARYHGYNVSSGMIDDNVVEDIAFNVPLIRTTENKHVFANAKGLYLQDVHPEILVDEASHNILTRYFKIKKYDEREDLKVRILSKYSKHRVDVSFDENVDDLSVLSNALQKQVLWYSEVAECYLISGKNAKTGKVSWRQPYSVFRTQQTGGETEYAETLLKGIHSFSFLDERYLDYINSGKLSWSDFDTLKVRSQLRVRDYEDVEYEIKTDAFPIQCYKRPDSHTLELVKKIYGFDYQEAQIANLRVNGYRNSEYSQIKETPEGKQMGNVQLVVTPQDDFNIGAFIPYLDEIIDSLSYLSPKYALKKSLALYRLLAESGNILMGKITWRRRKGDFEELETTIYSELGLHLRNKTWMYTKDKLFDAPCNLTPDIVSRKYRKISESLLGSLINVPNKHPRIIVEGHTKIQRELQSILSDYPDENEFVADLKHFIKERRKKKLQEQEKKSISESLKNLNRESSDYSGDDMKLEHPSPVFNVDRRTETLNTELAEKVAQAGGADRSIKGRRVVVYDSPVDNADNEKEKAFLWKEYGGKCQICSEQISISRGQHKYPCYFVASKLMPNKNLGSAYQQTNEIDGWNSLSLCPNCAAKIRYAQLNVDTVEEQIENITVKDGVSKTYGINIILDNKQEVITYTPKHILALKTVLAFLKKLESQE